MRFEKCGHVTVYGATCNRRAATFFLVRPPFARRHVVVGRCRLHDCEGQWSPRCASREISREEKAALEAATEVHDS